MDERLVLHQRPLNDDVPKDGLAVIPRYKFNPLPSSGAAFRGAFRALFTRVPSRGSLRSSPKQSSLRS